MARLARVVVAGLPHYVTQRGNRGQQVFFSADDYAAYLDLLGQWCRQEKVQVWAYCLMPNHVHLILVPSTAESLRRAVGECHRRYTRLVNFRQGWGGYLWQGRFASFVMDKPHLLAVARHIELNPVRAKLVRRPENWKWSSIHAHLGGQDDRLVKALPLRALAGDWRSFLAAAATDAELAAIRRHGRTGRPLGSAAFLHRLEKRLDRHFLPQKRGRKPRKKRS